MMQPLNWYTINRDVFKQLYPFMYWSSELKPKRRRKKNLFFPSKWEEGIIGSNTKKDGIPLWNIRMLSLVIFILFIGFIVWELHSKHDITINPMYACRTKGRSTGVIFLFVVFLSHWTSFILLVWIDQTNFTCNFLIFDTRLGNFSPKNET